MMDDADVADQTSAGTDPILHPGAQLAPGYVVQSHLNRGEVLDVYAVRSLDRASTCIAKTLRPSRLHDQAERDQLSREGRMLTSYTHPHLVRGYELIDHDGQPILIMETLTGATLSRLIIQQGVLDIDDVTILGTQLTALLHYLHRSGIVHLDLKPSNIVVDAGVARVIDLNLARPIGTAGITAGTYEYKAPEQITGDPVREATDIWGLGGILYRAITGHRPFPRDTTTRTPTGRPDLTDLGTHANRLAPTIAACFEIDPGNRPTLTQIRADLAAISDTATYEDTAVDRRKP
jgi:serine/threonine protein kinase